MSPRRAWLAWSAGKDSAWALHVARRDREMEVVRLLTTVTQPYDRVSMHAVRRSLLVAQAEAVGLPLHVVAIPAPCSEEQYAQVMRDAMQVAAAEGVTEVAFGDLFLQDVRAYREQRLAAVGLEATFPLWGRDTTELAREIIAGGLRAILTCVDPRQAPAEIAGAAYDEELLARLPAGVDPCGENGEFHTMVWDGPMFRHPLHVRVGDTVEREGFVFADVGEA